MLGASVPKHQRNLLRVVCSLRKSILPKGYEKMFLYSECDWPDNLNWLLDNGKPCVECGRYSPPYRRYKNSVGYKNWRNVLVNLKRCLNCRKPIERDQDCVHTCMSWPASCGYDFCCRCLDSWERDKSHYFTNLDGTPPAINYPRKE
ncbi:hypothetical protein R1flu_009567 [Riccia fluitans]|uniref:RING-type domain-containing protein n=1 Tax=Riccia fluitans TaxID=41844 RepID=A0ABD1Z2P4_9MARC